ncbi:hypothetical protein HYW46_00650 [Candidatus Daviesbacteria bacterium]|nr:hypothetical protein [Candidatus Daviesbacteria bacterium]
MNLIIMHGSGLSALSHKLSAIKKGFDQISITELNCKDVGLGQVLAAIATPQLFSDKRLVILEGFDPGFKLTGLPEDENLTVVLKSNKKLTASSEILKSTASSKPQVILFEEKGETNIFPFLDMLAEKKGGAFGQLENYLEEWGGQYVLTMIFYMLRRLILPVKKLPPFIAKKIELQKKNFRLEKITFLYKEALETDFKIKNGLIGDKLGLTMLVEKIIKV